MRLPFVQDGESSLAEEEHGDEATGERQEHTPEGKPRRLRSTQTTRAAAKDARMAKASSG